MKKISSLVDLQLDFLVPEHNLLLVGEPYSSIPWLYSTDSVKRDHAVSVSASKLLQACHMLAPGSTWSVKCAADSKLARDFAVQMLRNFNTKSVSSSPVSSNSSKQSNVRHRNSFRDATLVVLDRACDMITPLMHEFTYEAMAHDVLPLERNPAGLSYFKLAPSSSNEREQSNTSNVVVDPTRLVRFGDEKNDLMWNLVRHVHIADAASEINAALHSFVESNAAARFHVQNAAKRNAQPSMAPSSKAPTDSVINEERQSIDVSDLAKALRALPEYSVLVRQHAMHVQALSDCFSVFKSAHLDLIADLEQILAIGRNVRDKRVKSSFTLRQLNEILSRKELHVEDRLRVVLIAAAVACGSGRGAGEVSALFLGSFPEKYRLNVALPQVTLNALDHVELLSKARGFMAVLKTVFGDNSDSRYSGIYRSSSKVKMRSVRKKVRKARKQHKKAASNVIDYGANHNVLSPKEHGVDENEENDDEESDEEDDEHASDACRRPKEPYELSRYVPPLKYIALDAIDSGLDSKMYPILELNQNQTANGLHAHLLPIETQPKAMLLASDNEITPDYKRVVVIFVLGSVSYSEVRSAYEVERLRPGVHVIVASHSVLSPGEFLDACRAVDDRGYAQQIIDNHAQKPVSPRKPKHSNESVQKEAVASVSTGASTKSSKDMTESMGKLNRKQSSNPPQLSKKVSNLFSRK